MNDDVTKLLALRPDVLGSEIKRHVAAAERDAEAYAKRGAGGLAALRARDAAILRSWARAAQTQQSQANRPRPRGFPIRPA